MRGLLRLPAAIVLGGLIALGGCNPSDGQPSGSTGAASGKSNEPTQVVARVNGEEITVHQLNTELATVRAAGQDAKEVQKEVLRAIVLRTMLRQAAEKQQLARDPKTRILIESAKDKVLADAYLTTQTSTTPPPTSSQVAKFVSDNPLQFHDRRIYQFDRLTMPAAEYSELLLPMFDEKQTFDEFRKYLDGKAIAYTLTNERIASTEFPKEVQNQLAIFGKGDNVVVRGEQWVVILKIKGWTEMPVSQEEARRAAENILHQIAIQERAAALRGQLEHAGKIEFLGQFADLTLEAPAPAAANPVQEDLGPPSNQPSQPDATPPSVPGDGSAGGNRQEGLGQ